MHVVLEHFHPLIRQWFTEQVGEPTDIQIQAWPRIACGEHVLITAPTGSGKTLTAFLWALQQLITKSWPAGQVRVLYVSPLKALNNDVQRNLLKPLAKLRDYFVNAGYEFPDIRVLTRSGDTPQNERQRMRRQQPEILITTPESLNLLLSSPKSCRMVEGIKTVILDEIHAVLDSKRGTHLITAVDRIVALSGEFQRIALSATVRPPGLVADFIGGLQLRQTGDDYRYDKRPVTVCQSFVKKTYKLEICNARHMAAAEEDAVWQELAVAITAEIKKNRATLVFCNNRRVVEKMTWLINEYAGEPLVYSHHGSLSKELRLAVEEKLKCGGLKGIVATNSLELGIDIGDLDAVILVQTPPSLTSTIQRIGRAGHGVGQTSYGKLFPVFGRDCLEAAVTSLALPEGEIEPVKPIDAPLDVLAQVLLSMTTAENWDADELYAFLKTSYPYRNLSRTAYELVVEMLAGRYADSRLRELTPRIFYDRLDNTIKARENIARLLYQGGGTIPDRGYYQLRLADTKARIGELDEEFVWERNIGDTFLLGTQVWRILRITHNDVDVAPGDRTVNIIPFWRAEEQNRDFYYAEKIAVFLEEAERTAVDESLGNRLKSAYYWSAEAAKWLLDYLHSQRAATGKALPHRHHLFIEHLHNVQNKADNKQVVLHTLWGGRVNRPFALALAGAWEQKYGYPLEIFSNNYSIMLMLPHEFAALDLFSLVSPENLETLLRKKLESSGFFGAKFRENAGRALLLPKAGFKTRMPLWLNRIRAKRLLAAVAPYADFPVVLETWRNCLSDEFDLASLKTLLDEIRTGQIAISEAVTHQPSPFTADLIWRQVNQYMYEDDTPLMEKQSGLRDDLLKELVYTPHLRPQLPPAVIAELDEKLKRTAAGYTPADSEETLLWLKERLLIPEAEAEGLFAAIMRDYQTDPEVLLQALAGKAAWIQLPGSNGRALIALEVLPRLEAALGIPPGDARLFALHEHASSELAGGLQKVRALVPSDAEAGPYFGDATLFIGEWLSFYGPVSVEFICETFTLTANKWQIVAESLLEEESIVMDVMLPGTNTAQVCDRDNLERLFAMVRRAQRPYFQALPLSDLPLFLATYQGITGKGSSMQDLQERLEALFGYAAHAHLWEEAILPARMETYYSAWLDSLMQSSGLLWFGCGNKRTGFAFGEDLELFPCRMQDSKDSQGVKALFPDAQGKYDLLTLCRFSGIASDELTRQLWQYVWEGCVANDSFSVLRQGLLQQFSPAPLETKKRPGGRGGFNRWSATRPLAGAWFLLPEPAEQDPLAGEELVRARIRQLLLRYGVLFRELLWQELSELQWRNIFRSLRLMEFSGEIYSGHFFENIPGLQFIAPEAYRFLQSGLPDHAIYWLNAADPASVCGLKLPGLQDGLPSRLPSNFLVYQGSRLMVAVKRNGKAIDIFTAEDNPCLPACLEFFKGLLTRDYNPLRSITVETINGEPAISSPYKKAMFTVGFRGQYKFLELRRQYH